MNNTWVVIIVYVGHGLFLEVQGMLHTSNNRSHIIGNCGAPARKGLSGGELIGRFGWEPDAHRVCLEAALPYFLFYFLPWEFVGIALKGLMGGGSVKGPRCLWLKLPHVHKYQPKTKK